jgi:hypothetical protein
MKKAFAYASLGALAVLAIAFTPARAAAQDPIWTPVVASTAAPIIVRAIAPKPKPGTQKFHGYILSANSAEVTVKSKSNPMDIETFPLSDTAKTKMQRIIDKGGYQHDDKITVLYDTQTHKALSFKGRHSRPL